MRTVDHRLQQSGVHASATVAGRPRFGDLPPFLAIAAVVFLTRIPFLNAGYGAVHDAWRVAYAAHQIAVTHTYWADRFPPHPIQDAVSAILWPGRAIALNGATAVLGGVAAAYFALLVKSIGGKDYILAALALALTPVIFVDSTSSLDYIWALAFILGSFYFMVERKPLYAGIFLGLAIGCRVTSVLMLAPLGLLLFQERKSSTLLRRAVTLVVPAAALGIVAYVPGFIRYGTSLLGTHGAHEPLRQIIYDSTVALWGSIGTLALMGAAALLLFSLTGRWSASPTQRAEGTRIIPACLLTIFIYGVGFLLLPAQPGYLVPLVPFVLLLLAAWLPRKIFLTVSVALMVSSFVSIHAQGVAKGPIFSDHAERLAAMGSTRQMLAETNTLPSNSVVVAGHWLPILTVYLLNTRRPHARFVWLMNVADLQRAARNRQAVYYLPGQRQYNLNTYGVDLEKRGARPLLPSTHAERATR